MFNETTVGDFYLPEWKEAINAAEGTGNIYTEPNPFFYDSQINTIGQVYYKPVVVFNNAASYSATDMFSCIMRDNYIPVLGEEFKSGAGGANVLSHDFFAHHAEGPFVPLPKGHRMRTAFSQLLRFGPNEGKIIEDFGCDSTKVVSKTLSDLLDGGVNQLDIITKYITGRAVKYKSNVVIDPPDRTIFQDSDSLGFGITVTNTKYIRVWINGKFSERIYTTNGENEVYVPILVGSGTPGENIEVTIKGQGMPGCRSWNLKKTIIVKGETLVIGPEGYTKDFTTATSIDPMFIFNSNTAPEDGWNLTDGALQVGYNPTYVNNVNTDAILFLDLSQKTSGTLSFDMEMETELDFDFLNIYIDNGIEKLTIFSASGPIAKDTYSIEYSDLSSIISEVDNIPLHIHFRSDGSVTDKGVRITSLSIK